jgi:hypothetical protein
MTAARSTLLAPGQPDCNEDGVLTGADAACIGNAIVDVGTWDSSPDGGQGGGANATSAVGAPGGVLGGTNQTTGTAGNRGPITIHVTAGDGLDAGRQIAAVLATV